MTIDVALLIVLFLILITLVGIASTLEGWRNDAKKDRLEQIGRKLLAQGEQLVPKKACPECGYKEKT